MKDYKIQIERHRRREQTSAEAALWDILCKRKFENLKFKRLYPLKDYIADLYCDPLELVIELDGYYPQPKEHKHKDENRDLHLNFLGYRILRYSNETVFNAIELILEDIKTIIAQTENYFKKTKAPIKKDVDVSSSQQKSVGVRESNISNQIKQPLILSTKKLKLNQRDLLLGAGISLVDYDAITITFLDFETPSAIENAIFTSQNGVLSFLNKRQPLATVKNCFCVGDKTKALLEENGLKVQEVAQNSKELSEIIVTNYKNSSFLYLCGTMRREELPEVLKKEKIIIFQVKTYQTELKPKKFNQKWDGILFFSPSGVASYLSENKNSQDTIAYCIGNTTATSAQEHFENVVVANVNSIESVIAKVVKTVKIINI
jgi:uroporphyrinogen-III synthase